MVTTSILALFILGFVAAALLGVASKLLAVEEDPRVEAVVGVLPGANCGGCGYAGCENYAQAVVNDPNVPANLCVAGGEETGINVGNLTGKTVAAMEPQISFRRCEKVEGKVAVRFQYQGMPSCAAAALLAAGQGTDQCRYSCLGHGDCIKVCPFDALYLRDWLIRVNPARCTGCGQCTKACPRNILEIVPRRARVMVCCSTKDKGKVVTEICEAGCIQCLRCKRQCPAGAISIVDGRVHVDQRLCLSYGEECGQACVASCPRHILHSLCPATPLNQAEARAEQDAAVAANPDLRETPQAASLSAEVAAARSSERDEPKQ